VLWDVPRRLQVYLEAAVVEVVVVVVVVVALGMVAMALTKPCSFRSSGCVDSGV
jgi:hypothetical protein